MDQKTKTLRLAAVLFGGGTLLTLGFMIFAPTLGLALSLGIGLPLGAALGYFGYAFEQVLRAIPRAAAVAAPAVARAVPTALYAIGRGLRTFFGRPRPLFVLAGLLGFGIFNILYLLAGRLPVWWYAVFVALYTTVVGFFAHHIMILLALARRRNREYWRNRFGVSVRLLIDGSLNLFVAMSWRDGALLYVHAGTTLVWCIAMAIGYTFFAIGWLAWNVPRAIGRFAVALMRFIHSDERVVCAVHVPVGAAATYLGLRLHLGADALARLAAPELAGAALFGGLLTLVVGLVSYQLIGLRVMKTSPATRRR